MCGVVDAQTLMHVRHNLKCGVQGTLEEKMLELRQGNKSGSPASGSGQGSNPARGQAGSRATAGPGQGSETATAGGPQAGGPARWTAEDSREVMRNLHFVKVEGLQELEQLPTVPLPDASQDGNDQSM